MRAWFGSILNRIGMPGLIKETDYFDELTGEEVSVKTGKYFTVVSIGICQQWV
jgi:hypothetical protein